MSRCISNKKFAGFVMTYNRPEILLDTIEKILGQTYPPFKLLIVDNSEGLESERLLQQANFDNVEYFHTDFNSGPAGAAEIGLKRLSDEGYEWIYWGDDDDPPKFKNVFEKLIRIGENNQFAGALGVVGSKFNFTYGIVQRFKDEELKGILEVDSIGGGHCLIINGNAVRESKILPDSKLFFGFEEFDFLQRLKRKGYKLLVSGELLLKSRRESNRLGYNRSIKLVPPANKDLIKRKYYSTRNHIYIFCYKIDKWPLSLLVVLRAIVKIFTAYLNGFEFGNIHFKYSIKAIIDGYTKNMGQIKK